MCFYSREKLNSMNLLLYMAPIAVVFLLPATLIMEENVVGITLALARDDIKIIWYLLFNSALAYFVNLTNFLVTKHTSALTLQVCSSLLVNDHIYNCSHVQVFVLILKYVYALWLCKYDFCYKLLISDCMYKFIIFLCWL